MSDEKVFFKQSGITITNARFIVDSQTFAIRNITSVKAERVKQDNAGLGWMVGIGMLLVLIGLGGSGAGFIIFGVLLAGLGFVLIWKQKDLYAVSLATSAGEVKAYKCEDKQLISGIVAGLNDAITHNG